MLRSSRSPISGRGLHWLRDVAVVVEPLEYRQLLSGNAAALQNIPISSYSGVGTANISANLVLDSQGDLFGAAGYTLFEIPSGSASPT